MADQDININNREQLINVMDSLEEGYLERISDADLKHMIMERIMSLSKEKVSRSDIPTADKYHDKQLAKTNDDMIKKIVEFSFQLDHEAKNSSVRKSRVLSADRRSSISRSKSEIGLDDASQNGDRRSNSSVRLSQARPASEKSNGGPVKLSKQEQKLSDRLAYEWKNIYRMCYSRDIEQTGLIDIKDFDDICLQLKVRLSREELGQLQELFGQEAIINGGASTKEQSRTSPFAQMRVHLKSQRGLSR